MQPHHLLLLCSAGEMAPDCTVSTVMKEIENQLSVVETGIAVWFPRPWDLDEQSLHLRNPYSAFQDERARH